jgi:protein O-mannosyl-transferase
LPNTQTKPSDRWARLAVVLVPLLCFARAVLYPFARSWDDGRFIVDNPDVLNPSWDALVRMFTSVQFEAYHPLHLLSYWLDMPFTPGPDDLQLTATVAHATSLLLWIAGLSISYQVMRLLGAEPYMAALGTLLFGVHPAQVEVVCWASGRKDVLALLFTSASLYMQLSAAKPFDARAWLSRAFYVCALLSKTTALPLPLVAFALDTLARKRSLREALIFHAPSLLLGAGVSVSVLTIWEENSMLRQTLGDESMAFVRFVQTLGHQLCTALWPSSVSPMYAGQSIGDWQLARTLAFALYVLACLVALRSQRKLTAAGLLGFALFLLPASNLVALYFPLQDRYASLPLFALGVAVAGLRVGPELAPAPKKKKPKPAAARGLWREAGAVVLLCLGVRTLQYASVWQSELRLWGHAVRTQPDSDYAYLKLGEVRREAGDFEGAIAAYRGAIGVAPLRTLAHAGLFEVVARRDERQRGMLPSRARQLAQQYYQRLSNIEALRAFPAELWSMGYVRAVELPIQALLILEDVPEGIVLQSAQSALKAERRSLAKFYLHALKEPPEREPLASLYKEPYFRVVP